MSLLNDYTTESDPRQKIIKKNNNIPKSLLKLKLISYFKYENIYINESISAIIYDPPKIHKTKIPPFTG